MGQCTYRAVEHVVVRCLSHQVRIGQILMAQGPKRLGRIDLALHHVIFAIDPRKTAASSTRISPYMPLAMWAATIGVAQ